MKQQPPFHCQKCATELGETNWYASSRRRHYRICKSCQISRTKAWMADNSEKYKTYQRSYYEQNREALIAYAMNWNATHPERVKEAREKRALKRAIQT